MTPAEVRATIASHLRPTRIIDGGALASGLTLVSEIGQHTGSFKARGALGAASYSSAPHLLTASSGNFGAALAWAAARSGRRCTVVMPASSVARKIEAVRAYGATVELVDTATSSRAEKLAAVAAATPGGEVLSPYDDDRVIFGNSTLGHELFAAGAFDAIVVPVGGGGLASGIVVARDELDLPTPVFGAEPALGDDGARSLARGVLVANEREPATICDGARTLSLGERNFAILRHGLAAMLTVDDDAVSAAMTALDALGITAEPTGALAVAALQQNRSRFGGQRIACILSGGNRAPG